MKIFNFITTTLVIAAFMTSCSKDHNGEKENGDVKAVNVKIEKSTLSRAETTPVGSVRVTFGEGHLFFVSSTGTITKYMTIGSAATTDDHLNLTEATTTGVRIQNVPSNSNRIFVLSNLPSAVSVPSTPVNMPISAIQELILTISQLSDGSGGVTAVPLYGSGTIDEVATGKYEAECEIRAVGSRLEVEKFTATGDVKSYTIDGIFLNYYYASMQVGGTLSGFTDNGTENATNTKYLPGSAEYPYLMNGILYDHNNSGLGAFNTSTRVYAPSTPGRVWAYNIFPTTAHPHIVVRLSNVEYTNGTKLADPQYLTILGFTAAGADFVFEAGKAYKISSVVFDEKDLTDKPEVGRVEVEVKIELIDWSTIEIDPKL